LWFAVGYGLAPLSQARPPTREEAALSSCH